MRSNVASSKFHFGDALRALSVTFAQVLSGERKAAALAMLRIAPQAKFHRIELERDENLVQGADLFSFSA
ncbi:hypothetical protein [Microvirga terricola]|uniref:Uncharacterized protein n=1 Tax=Microvirga terricola TaxID=2719797 RepID=A0ABX0VES6_9HYPH|nr:hypothetical protein [Microvirga terricola]NIX78340.1 hypothetical protein [Microvirga terricola]